MVRFAPVAGAVAEGDRVLAPTWAAPGGPRPLTAAKGMVQHERGCPGPERAAEAAVLALVLWRAWRWPAHAGRG